MGERAKKIPASQLGDDRAREILHQEKKLLVDSLKLLAYNAEEWLLEILAREYSDFRDFRRILLLIMKKPGTIQRINQMEVPAPSGKGILHF